MNRAYLPILILVASVFDLMAYERGDAPDYDVIFKTADIVVLAQVTEIILPRKLTHQTEVVLKVARSLKGEFKKGEVVRIFHDSGEAITRIRDGMSVTESAFRCPAFPRFSVGEDVKLCAQWDKKMKRYFVPSHRWKVTQTK